MNSKLAVVRGGGDIATGVIQKLFRAGFKVLVLEMDKPTCIRRTVSLAEAMYSKEYVVEDLRAVRANSKKDIARLIEENKIPIIAAENPSIIRDLNPDILVDAILAKANKGTEIDMADLTIGLGPGFVAGVDTDLVIETNRGHNLGRIIYRGKAVENTGTPGDIGGYTWERVIYSAYGGRIKVIKEIGSLVEKGDIIAYVDEKPIEASLSGIVRGMIHTGLNIKKAMKIADIDPRSDKEYIYTISDKARAVGGAVLDAVMYKYKDEIIWR